MSQSQALQAQKVAGDGIEKAVEDIDLPLTYLW